MFKMSNSFKIARDRIHATELAKLGIDHFVRETFHSGLEAACKVLKLLGYSEHEASTLSKTFAEHDAQQLDAAISEHMEFEDLVKHSKQGREALKSLFKNDSQ